MDDNETEEQVDYAHARRHSRWTVVVLSLNFAARVFEQAAEFAGELTIAAAQHSNQLDYDKKFGEITGLMEE